MRLDLPSGERGRGAEYSFHRIQLPARPYHPIEIEKSNVDGTSGSEGKTRWRSRGYPRMIEVAVVHHPTSATWALAPIGGTQWIDHSADIPRTDRRLRHRQAQRGPVHGRRGRSAPVGKIENRREARCTR